MIHHVSSLDVWDCFGRAVWEKYTSECVTGKKRWDCMEVKRECGGGDVLPPSLKMGCEVHCNTLCENSHHESAHLSSCINTFKCVITLRRWFDSSFDLCLPTCQLIAFINPSASWWLYEVESACQLSVHLPVWPSVLSLNSPVWDTLCVASF